MANITTWVLNYNPGKKFPADENEVLTLDDLGSPGEILTTGKFWFDESLAEGCEVFLLENPSVATEEHGSWKSVNVRLFIENSPKGGFQIAFKKATGEYIKFYHLMPPKGLAREVFAHSVNGLEVLKFGNNWKFLDLQVPCSEEDGEYIQIEFRQLFKTARRLTKTTLVPIRKTIRGVTTTVGNQTVHEYTPVPVYKIDIKGFEVN